MPVVDPDLELRGGPGLDLLARSAIFPSVISSFFTQNKGGPPGPSPRSATACIKSLSQKMYSSGNKEEVSRGRTSGPIILTGSKLHSLQRTDRNRRASLMPGGGGGALPYLGYTGTCRWIGYGFLASLS